MKIQAMFVVLKKSVRYQYRMRFQHELKQKKNGIVILYKMKVTLAHFHVDRIMKKYSQL